MKGLVLVLLAIAAQSSATYGKHVVLKRQVEQPDLQVVVEQLSATVEQLQAQVLALQEKLGKVQPNILTYFKLPNCFISPPPPPTISQNMTQ